MSAYHFEWARTPNSRAGIMIPEENLQKFIDANGSSGFRSVFGFHPNHAKIIKARGNSKGFKEFPCYADQLVIDIDNGDEGKIDAEAKIKAAGLGYKLYFSGGKGYHFIIPCTPLYSYHTPYSHMRFVESLGFETDLSVYRHSSLISLEGRVHPKTKKLKRFLEEVAGKPAAIKIVQPPQFVGNIPEDYDVLADGFERASKLTGIEPSMGDRYMALWRCIKCFSDAGITPEVAEEIAHAINDSWDNPKELDEMQRLMEDCYGRG